MTREIQLNRGYLAIVDDEDYEALAQFKWRASTPSGGLIYAVRTVYSPRKSTQWMHKVVLGVGQQAQCDHANKNSLDNRRANLRACDHSQNMMNRRAWGASAFKGVDLSYGSWRARIHKAGKLIYLGVFDSEEAAARAYDEAAILHHGPFANLNFVREAA